MDEERARAPESEQPHPERERAPGGGGGGGGRQAFLLRLPPELLAELRSWAAGELRSLNGHIEYLLRQAVKRRRGEGPGET